MNPYALLAAAGWWAYGAGRDAELATQAREDRAVAVATDAAAKLPSAALAVDVEFHQIHQHTDCSYSIWSVASLPARNEKAALGRLPLVRSVRISVRIRCESNANQRQSEAVLPLSSLLSFIGVDRL